MLVGIATEWCVLFTAIDAYVRGYSLWVRAGLRGDYFRRAARFRRHLYAGRESPWRIRLEEVFPTDAAAVARCPRDAQTT